MGARYTQLSLEERREIERWRHAKVSVNEIARVLKRHRSTIFRELERNHFFDAELPKVVGYFGVAVHSMTRDRRSRQRKLIRWPDLCSKVVERVKDGWTPEQISNRMILENAVPRVCQETIYRYIYSAEGMKQELWWYLPNHRKSRLPRLARKKLKSKFRCDVSILFRPEAVGAAKALRPLEGDLMLFKQHFRQFNVTSLVERVSRFMVLLKTNPNTPGQSWTKSQQC